jgi:effector-binding domain-containing protein
MEHEIKVRQRKATLVMSRRLPVRLSEIGAVMGQAFGDVYGHLTTHGGEPAGPPFVIYHGMPGADNPFDIEICAPVARATGAATGWQVQELPAGMFATLTHVGPYDTVGTSYEALASWIATHDLTVAGPPREVYLSPADTPPEQVRTVIEFPVVEALAPVAGR